MDGRAAHRLEEAWIPTVSTMLFSHGIWHAEGSAQAVRQHCLGSYNARASVTCGKHGGGGRNMSSSSLHSRWHTPWWLCPSLRHVHGPTPQPQAGSLCLPGDSWLLWRSRDDVSTLTGPASELGSSSSLFCCKRCRRNHSFEAASSPRPQD